MKKFFLLFLALLPLLSYAQTEKTTLEQDVVRFIAANNSLDCPTLLYYTPKLVLDKVTESDFLNDCEHMKLKRMNHISKTWGNRFSIDELVVHEEFRYANVYIPVEVTMEFADAEATEEFHDDTFYYQIIEAYCDKLIDRSDVGKIFIDHENHQVIYSCTSTYLALWEDNHWKFLKQQDTEDLQPIDVVDPETLY